MPTPIIIAGPCSVESIPQLRSVVESLVAIPQVSMIRCGVWKPRTRPGGFEGLGEKALSMIRQLRDELGLSVPFACEVARPKHVDLALKYGMDSLWVGARTTANPFMVQELSEALRGTQIQMMVKNPPSPDVKLWVGAIERFCQVGLSNVWAVHRGFDVMQNSGCRNNPLWEVPIEFRRLMPQVPLICDPSHIAGRREPLQSLSQLALNMGFDGLMIEVHSNPDEALTDAEQQITPQELLRLLEALVLRCTDSRLADRELQVLRSQIDALDAQLLRVLAQRLAVSAQIAQVKQQDNLAVFQPKRWESLLHQRLESAEQLGLEPEFIKRLFETIHAESVRVQQEIIS